MTSKQVRVTLLIATGVVVLVVAGLSILLATLDGDWLRDALRKKATTALGAELEIESVEFQPLQGRAVLAGAHLVRERDTSQLDVRLDEAFLKVSVLPLLFRYLSIERLELAGPAIRFEHALPHRAGSTGTLDKVKRFVKKHLGDDDGDTSVIKISIPRDRWHIGQMLIRDGKAVYIVTRPDEPATRIALTGIEYAAGDISLDRLTNILDGADIRGTIDFGGPATLEKVGSREPGTLAIRGLDLSALDRLFAPTDALVVTGGNADVGYTTQGDDFEVSVTLHDLQLTQNPDAAFDEFLFIPVEKLRRYVAEHGKQLDLAFTYDGEKAAGSDDLVFIAEALWEGMLVELMKEVGARTKDELIDKAAEKLNLWVERRRGQSESASE